MKTPAWSFSSLNDFLNCPRQYQLKRVTKEVKQTETEAMRYGTECHLHLEHRMSLKTTLPEHLSWLEPMMDKIERSGGVPIVEEQMAVTKGLKPSGWKDADTWCRGIVDGGVRYKGKSILYDWKTGKRKFDHDQLMLFAGFEFAHKEEVESVKTGYVWLKDKKVDVAEYTRKDVPMIWGHFLPKVERMEKAYETDTWLAKPSGLCNGWCPATVLQCKHKRG